MPHLTGFPRVLENLENNRLILQVLEMSLNLSKSGNELEMSYRKILSVKKSA